MARLIVKFREYTHEGVNILATTEVIGAKQTKSWIRKNYGPNYNGLDDDMYYIKKKNPYGLVWLVKHNGYWSFTTTGKEEIKAPSFDIIVYKY